MKKDNNSEVEEKDISTAESSDRFESGSLDLSSSVFSAMNQFQEDAPISAAALARGRAKRSLVHLAGWKSLSGKG